MSSYFEITNDQEAFRVKELQNMISKPYSLVSRDTIRNDLRVNNIVKTLPLKHLEGCLFD